MKKEEIEVLEKQLDGMKEVLNKEDNILKERLEDFFCRLTNYDFRLGLQVKFFGNFEIYCCFDFMSLTKPNETDFGSDFTLRYEPMSCLSKDKNNYAIKVNNGSIGEYCFEKNPLNVERTIVMGRMWQKREELKKLFEDFCNEFRTDYLNYDRFRVIVDREKENYKHEEERKQKEEVRKLIEGEGFKFVAKDFRNYEVTVTVEKVARVNYHLKAEYKFAGEEENKRWYRDYVKQGTYNKEAFINSYIWFIIKNQDNENLELQRTNFLCNIGSKLKIAYN